jgi:hypothetical protein
MGLEHLDQTGPEVSPGLEAFSHLAKFFHVGAFA